MKQLVYTFLTLFLATASFAQSPHLGGLPESIDSLQQALMQKLDLDGLKESVQSIEFSKIDDSGNYLVQGDTLNLTGMLSGMTGLLKSMGLGDDDKVEQLDNLAEELPDQLMEMTDKIKGFDFSDLQGLFQQFSEEFGIEIQPENQLDSESKPRVYNL